MPNLRLPCGRRTGDPQGPTGLGGESQEFLRSASSFSASPTANPVGTRKRKGSPLAYPVVGRVFLSAGIATTVATLSFAATASADSGGASLGGSAPAKQAVKRSIYKGDSRHMGDRLLRAGMSGHDVRVLQDFLTRDGLPTTIDGQFGPGTLRNVIKFQRTAHMRANGVVSYTVQRALRLAVAGKGRSVASTAPGAKAVLNSNGTVSAPAGAPAAVRNAIAAANKIAFTPYVFGGGHGSFSSSGYDCSGSVSYALHGGGLLSSPEDSSQLESYGGSGPGQWITIWANSGHTYMQIAGLFFDTGGASGRNGDRWSRTNSSGTSGYVVRHPTGY
jgi:peptidoglycan hydrolase-like protein with peptidoglycan-binding domain